MSKIFGVVVEVTNEIASVMLTETAQVGKEWRPTGSHISAKLGPEVTVNNFVVVEDSTAYLYFYALVIKRRDGNELVDPKKFINIKLP